MSSIDNFSDEELPEDILEAASVANLDLLPKKSLVRYEKQYEHFVSWCEAKKVKAPKEEVLLAYFLEMSKLWKPNTLWSRYSMLKSVLKVKKDLDISKYYKVTAYIKRQNVGFRAKKAKVFTQEDITKFMKEAPDEIYLLIKVVIIFGLAGACRCEELTKLTIDDIDDKGNVIIVTIKDSKNHSARSFVITKEVNNESFLNLYRKYASLRPQQTPHRRFFLNYKHGKCSTQCVGINTIGKMPSNIAAYIGLKNPELYTGHSFRRSSATLLANSGEEITNIKRLGGWKSTSVAEGYLEESITQKKDMSNKILNLNIPSNLSCSLEASTSSKTPQFPSSANNSSIPLSLQPSAHQDQLASMASTCLASAINLHNASNCTFNINIIN